MRRREVPRERAVLIVRLISFLVCAMAFGQILDQFSTAARLLDYFAIVTLALVWTLPMRWAVWGVSATALWVAAFGLDGLVMSFMGIGLTAFFAHRAARLLDMEFWILQPFVALFILGSAELVIRFAYFLYHGQTAPTPILAIFLTALFTPIGWLLSRRILLQPW